MSNAALRSNRSDAHKADNAAGEKGLEAIYTNCKSVPCDFRVADILQRCSVANACYVSGTTSQGIRLLYPFLSENNSMLNQNDGLRVDHSRAAREKLSYGLSTNR